MPLEPQALANTINNVQVIAGLVLLAVLLIVLHRTGRLRRAFVFPPATPNALTGAHLLLVLAAFYAAMLLVSSVLQTVRPTIPVPATATAPADTRPAEQPEDSATQPAAPASEPAATQPPSQAR